MSNLFLRHGEVHNLKDIMYGDIPGYRLSTKGIAQAKNAADYIKANFTIEKIISSPVLRARETSEYVADVLQVEVDISHNLYEWSGVIGWTGTTFNEFSNTEDYPIYKNNPIDVINTAETLQSVYERVGDLYHSVDNALLVSHQDTIRAFTFFETKSSLFNNEKPEHCGIQEVSNEIVITHTY
ncbi:MAG: hypothetical protein CMK40_03270 [Porticoccaceae bacterium]|nr:hypothetical protein [Porticoccaceae bacterium]|tara:strand:- start:4262 stop:4810 length:549 start_codon:yes stop_codon:yes gene_type:complete